MRKYVAGFDIDGVIGDFVSRFRALVQDRYKVNLLEEDIRAHDLYLALGVSSPEALELVHATLAHPEYEIYPGAADGLRALVVGGVEVHIITARWNGEPDARARTEEWLASRGLTSGTHYNRIDAVKEGQKFAVDAALDSFVDDNLVELLRMAERRPEVRSLIVYDHPWNQTLDVGGRLRRVRAWDELVPLLIGEAELAGPAPTVPGAAPTKAGNF
jgi:5'(3')-deoxyribonucleotidase